MTATLPRERPRAKGLPIGTVVTVTGPNVLQPEAATTVLVRRDKPGRCPWRLGPLDKGGRWVATWRVQDLINDGAQVARPALAGVKRR